MITFPCRFIDTAGVPCTGHVKYKAGPVALISLLADFKIHPELSLDDLPEIKANDQFTAALNAHVKQREAEVVKLNLKKESKPKLAAKVKTIYLTCDAEAMHVEPYEIPSK